MDDQLKVALVTGASRGIGRAIADALAGAGFAVIGTATSSAGAEQITARFVEKNFVGQGMVLNVNDVASISLLLKEVEENFGAPTVLVNNAGITKDNILLRMKEDEWSDVVNTNLNAVFRLSKACVRAMTKAKWGRIVNISSVVGSMGNSGQSNYSATKAGVEGFSRALAKELGSRNITVNSVAPGFIDTDMTKNLPVASKDAMLSQIPLARLGEPSEIADVVSFLVSDSAGYITGETIHVNGGMYMA
ncbi:MAG: 3-oxoacyl-ACP reductase FabG [Porticoccaceae bacterium]|nr:3-oxoacyl-ACP reductase FabG [Porticoccaceae bacterium]